MPEMVRHCDECCKALHWAMSRVFDEEVAQRTGIPHWAATLRAVLGTGWWNDTAGNLNCLEGHGAPTCGSHPLPLPTHDHEAVYRAVNVAGSVRP